MAAATPQPASGTARRPQPPPRTPRAAATSAEPAPRSSPPRAEREPTSPSRPSFSPIRLGDAATLSDVGRRMHDNEDAALSLPDVPLYAIADGSGALWPAGLTLRVLTEHARHISDYQDKVANETDSSSRLAVGHFFESVFNLASRMVKEEMGRRAEGRATAAAVALTLMGPFAYVAHVGDARAYLYRDRKLRCLTTDHTLAMVQLKRGELSPEDYQKSPFKKTLTQAIGVTPELRPDIAEVRVAAGDLLLLCSDGLHRMLSDRQIFEILGLDLPVDARAERLVEAANEAGGKDNITVHLVPVLGSGADDRAGDDAGDGDEAQTSKRSERVDIARVLGKCFLFEKISDAERLLIAPYFEYQAYDAGAVICREGDPGDSLFVVVQGRIRVTYQRAHLIDIGPGGWAGEIALAREGPRTATLTARDKVLLLTLTRARFLEIMRRRPALGTQLALPLLEFVGRRVIDLRSRFSRISELMAGHPPSEGMS